VSAGELALQQTLLVRLCGGSPRRVKNLFDILGFWLRGVATSAIEAGTTRRVVRTPGSNQGEFVEERSLGEHAR